eukprot:COSAG01_NODE_8697_length_2693_cov_2.548574_3_plen_120_part_00
MISIQSINAIFNLDERHDERPGNHHGHADAPNDLISSYTRSGTSPVPTSITSETDTGGLPGSTEAAAQFLADLSDDQWRFLIAVWFAMLGCTVWCVVFYLMDDIPNMTEWKLGQHGRYK